MVINITNFNYKINGIKEIALEIYNIDNSTRVYISADENVIIIKMIEPDLYKIKKIEEKIKMYSENNGILSNYSELIISTKLNMDNESILVNNVYSLPSMEQIVEKESIYKLDTGMQ